MCIKYRKSYKFAVKSAAVITLFSLFLIVGLQYVFFTINILFTVTFVFLFFVFSFFVLQYLVELFNYRRIQKIYIEFIILDVSVLRCQPVNTVMQTLIYEVIK